MSAAAIAVRLGRARREGRNWRCLCPVHGGVSLSLADGHDGSLLVHCFAGCDRRDVWNELRNLGLIGGRGAPVDPKRTEQVRRREAASVKAEIARLRLGIERARALVGRSRAVAGTLVEGYWQARGLASPVPQVLRFVRHCQHRNGGYFPAMVAPIVNVVGIQIGAIATFLRADGCGKAGLPKDQQREFVGPRKGGAVRLAGHRPGVPLLVGEGLESTAAGMQLFGLPGWAALSADGIRSLELPEAMREVVIAADHDENQVGYAAALTACERWQAEGRRVEILMPPGVGDDFNDVLRRGPRR